MPTSPRPFSAPTSWSTSAPISATGRGIPAGAAERRRARPWRLGRRVLALVMVAAALLACDRDSAVVSLTWRHTRPQPSGPGVSRDFARASGGKGAVEVRGQIEFSGRCPDLRFEVDRDDHLLGFHLLARSSPNTARSCLASDSIGALEYVARIARLPPGRFRVHVRHDVETPREHDHGPGSETHSGTSVRTLGQHEVSVHPLAGRSTP